MALPSHAVPQNILEVEFQLFGSLTIKQFAYIAGGIGLALVSYWIFGKVPIIQWPLSIFFLIIGLMLALWKINEMPFEVWLMNYVAAIFTTQRSIYQKSKKVTSIFDILDKSTTKVTTQKNSFEDSALAAVNASYSLSKQNIVDKVEDNDLKDIDSLFSNIFNSNSQISAAANSYFENYNITKKTDEPYTSTSKLSNTNISSTKIENSKVVANSQVGLNSQTQVRNISSYNNTNKNASNFPVIVSELDLPNDSVTQFTSELDPKLLPVIQNKVSENLVTRFELDDIEEPITKYTKSQVVPEPIIQKQQDFNSFLQDSAARLITAKKLEKKDTNNTI